MSLEIIKKKFSELTPYEIYEIIHLRLVVFLKEQKIYYVDTDDLDYQSTHYFFFENGKVLSYLRVIPKGVKNEHLVIGRVVTDANYRKQGLSSQLIKKVLEDHQGEKVYLHGQAYLQNFYENLGFKTISDAFIEEDVLHYEMLNDNKF